MGNAPKEKGKKVRGPRAFINRYAEHMQTPTRRGLGTKHAQTVYHAWKRREKMRHLQQSADLTPEELQVQVYDPKSIRAGKVDDSGYESTAASGNLHRPPGGNLQTLGRLKHSNSLPSPLTILRKGNSDPFGTMIIQIDPQINKLLVFGREVLVSYMYSKETRPMIPSRFVEKTWQHGIETLHDGCSGWAWLSAMIEVHASHTQDTSLMVRASAYRDRTSVALRTRLQDQRNWNDLTVYSAILALFAAEMSAQNIPAATVHAKTLSQLIRRNGGVDKANPWMLGRAVVTDVVRAVFTMSRSFFAFPEWQITPLYLKLDRNLKPRFPQRTNGFETADIDGELLRILKTLRNLLEINTLLIIRGSVIETKTFQAMEICKRVCEARLLNYYLNTKEAYDAFTPLESAVKDTPIRIAVSIATLYWCWMLFYPSAMAHQGGILLHQLASATTLCEERSSWDTAAPGLKLWINYVGAMAEQATTGGLAEKEWHNVLFAKQATEMGFGTWLGIQETLKDFLYSDSMKPHGSEWFWRTLASSFEGLRVKD